MSSGPYVVKLGGSLWTAPSLRAWLKAVVEVAGPARLVVPGGGPFADAVRTAQPVLGFDEVAAHRMAILAMQQYAHALASLEPRLPLFENEAQLRSSRAGIWLPWALAGTTAELPASWSVTSDSIAAWLARRLDARGLVLVKSVPAPKPLNWARLAHAGIVDDDFAVHAGRLACPVHLLAADRPGDLGAVLAPQDA